ncbi:hypothetical protein IV203_032772 [Nitzschia inconspicua]|uniref:Uncharacterized protein n=1 Tax=Nitzschia inconspicua TaxID=303405 RepID=A0A9K3KKZ3_9STRA|nr:hypothetical protein IV203_032772 [Nitzschia inconspicua]
MGNKLPTPPLHSTHDENGEEAASNSSVSTDSEDSSTDSSDDEVDLEAEGEEASLLTNGSAYYNMFLGLEEEEDECVKPNVKKRRGAKGVVYYRGEQGQPVVVPPTRSVWYGIGAERITAFRALERREDRLCWKTGRSIGAAVLTALRYLGRGWTFDDLSEATAISEEVIRVFFHRYIEFGSTTLFQKYVLAPTTLEHANQQGNEYTMAGLAGAVGSMDITHVLCHKVKHKLRQSHLGFKLNGTARTYNLVCNHIRQILSTTTDNPARWNDKTIIKFDSFVMKLYNGDNLSDVFPFKALRTPTRFGRHAVHCIIYFWRLMAWTRNGKMVRQGDGGNHDATDVRFAISRLNNPGTARNYDSSAMGPGNNRDTDVPQVDSVQMLPHRQPAINSLRALTLEEFRN